MRAYGDAGLQFRVSRDRVRDKVRLGLVLRIRLVVGLANFTFCHTRSPQKAAGPHFTHNPCSIFISFRLFPCPFIYPLLPYSLLLFPSLEGVEWIWHAAGFVAVLVWFTCSWL